MFRFFCLDLFLSVPKHVYLELLEKYNEKTRLYEKMETEQEDLKMKLNDLEKNQGWNITSVTGWKSKKINNFALD